MNRTELNLYKNEGLPIDNRGISFIQLQGEPYQRRLSNGEFIDCNITATNLVESNGYRQTLDQRIEQEGFYTLDDKLKHGQSLSFSEAFSLAAFVCTALNRSLNETVLICKIRLI